MTIVLNTLADVSSDRISALIPDKEAEIINTSDMKIAHCIGCNQCWLKSPGVCAIKDDYETIIKKLVSADNLWIVSDTHFGFLDHRGKKLADRLVPLLTMYIEFRGGWLRHQLRYRALNIGVIYQGDGNHEFLEEWCERASQNLGGHSLGAIAMDDSDKSFTQDTVRKSVPEVQPMKHVVIINGSPRTRQHSNTDKIIQSFVKGFDETGLTYDLYSLSSRKEWAAAYDAFLANDHIIIALPLYVECAPSLLLEFIETLPTVRPRPANLSFILHGGFEEGNQLRLGERFLQMISESLGCTYGGTLVRGGTFLIRMKEDKKMEKQLEKLISSFAYMGRSFAYHGNFQTKEAKKFTGPERYPWLLRQIVGILLRKVVNKNFERFAQHWGCTSPLDKKVYE